VATSKVAAHHDCVSSILKDIQEICVASQGPTFEEKNPRIQWLIFRAPGNGTWRNLSVTHVHLIEPSFLWCIVTNLTSHLMIQIWRVGAQIDVEVIDPCQAKSLISHARERTPLELHEDKRKPVSRISTKFLNHLAKQISVQDSKTRFYTHVVHLCLGKLQSKSVI